MAPAVIDGAGNITREAVVIGIGTLLVAIIDFVLIAFVVFLLIKGMNKAKEIAEAKKKKAEEMVVEEVKAPTTEELLAEILSELKKNNK